jgi:carbonic anhydrase
MNLKYFPYFLFVFIFTQFFILTKEPEQMTPEIALQKLIAGNLRYTKDQLLHPNHDRDRREEVFSKQNPFAIIVGCSDSRVPPEIIFDQGIGDLFIVRVAGNVVGQIGLDSINFSATQLHSSLILVLGHQNCGAVNAVLNNNIKGIEAIAEKIAPAIQQINKDQSNALEQAIKANVKMIVEQLKSYKVIADIISQKKIQVVGGYYHLESGLVELIP